MVSRRPEILIGTYNKMLEYTSSIYADLYCTFRRSLRRTQRLIVCGYGFGDKGINRQLREWTDSSDQNLMCVIHNDPEGLVKRVGTDIDHGWDRWLYRKQLKFVQKWIQDTSWKEVRDAIQK